MLHRIFLSFLNYFFIWSRNLILSKSLFYTMKSRTKSSFFSFNIEYIKKVRKIRCNIIFQLFNDVSCSWFGWKMNSPDVRAYNECHFKISLTLCFNGFLYRFIIGMHVYTLHTISTTTSCIRLSCLFNVPMCVYCNYNMINSFDRSHWMDSWMESFIEVNIAI